MTIANLDREQETETAIMAVLFADLASFTRHTAQNEARTLDYMSDCFALFQRRCEGFDGTFVKTMGDGILAIFPTASKALDYAMALQPELVALRPDATDYAFRIGVHSGEVRLRSGDVFGHAVNVASRIEGFAPPGGVCVSHEVFALIRHSSPYDLESIGARVLKNVDQPMMLYAVQPPGDRVAAPKAAVLGEIETIGGLRFASDGVPARLPTAPGARATLGYLAVCPGQSESLARLGAVIAPPDADDLAQVAAAAADHLTPLLGDGIEQSGGVVRLDPRVTRVDIREIEAGLKQGRVDPVLMQDARWADRLLDGLDDVSPGFAGWVAVARSEWRERLAILLETRLGAIDADADPGVREAATAILAIEDAHETAARRLIGHHMAVGNPGAARRVFDKITTVLRDRYGITPRRETLAALDGQPETVSHRAPASRAMPLRLQIHSFDIGGDLSDRLTAFRSELMAGLACFRGWSVVEGVQEQRGEDGLADYAVTVRPASESGASRIDVSLAEVATGRLVWSDTFDIGSGKFDLARRKVVGRIAATLEVFVTTDRTSAQSDRSPHDVIDRWLEAERMISRWTPEGHDAAAAIFEDLIAQSPGFAPAYASLASILNVRHIVRPGVIRDAALSHRAHRLSEQAVELDPLDARNQLAAGWSAALDGAFDKASVHLDVATRLNPHSPRTLMSCAMGFSFLGEHGRAAEHLAHSLECAPVLLDYQWCYAASVYFLGGNEEAALEAARRSGNKIIDNPGWTAAALSRMGRRAEAAMEFTALARDISANWSGPDPATPQAVRNWFINAYPFRHDAERDLLGDALMQAMQGLNQMPGEG